MISLAVAISLAAAPLQILQSETTPNWQRVRLVTKSDTARPIVGTLAPATGELMGVRVTDAGTTVFIHRADVAQLSVSNGASARAGFRKGFLVGLGVGAGVLAVTIRDAEDLEVPFAVITALVLVPVPFALAGAMLAQERWARVSVPAAPTLTASVQPSIRFGPGERVRVMTSSGIRSGFAKATSDSLILSDGTRLPWREVSTLSVRSRRDRGAAAVIGGLIGLGVGIGASLGSPSPDASANLEGILLTTASFATIGSRFLPISKWVALPIPK
jgi:hypothetical protein